MSYEPKPAQSIPEAELANSRTNGNSDYNGGAYQGSVARFITPGGNPIDNSQPAFPVFHRKFANPSPLGLMGFAATTFVLSMYNVQARGIKVPNLILGMALGYGGLVQLLAGMWEFASGNTFAATAFSSYGGFWLAFGAIYIPQFGIVTAYGDNKSELDSALAIFLASWFIVTFIFFVASWKSSIALTALFFFLDITFLLLMCFHLSGKSSVRNAGGAFGIITAFIAFYIALAGLLTKDTSYFSLPVGDLSRASTPKNSN
jgi:succinate-acetate transporter protein